MSIKEIYNKIKQISDFKPSPEVNTLFTSLVSWAVDIKESEGDMLSEEDKEDLRSICSTAEYEMEKYWAQKILEGQSIKDFWYYKNYSELTHLEWSSICYCKEHRHKVLFIGGGPLPMTSIILALEHGIESIVLEKDEEAYSLSKEVIKRIGLEKDIKVLQADAFTYSKYHDFNTIFVASLVGASDDEKIKLFENIKINSDKHVHLIVRSAWGKREYLYKKIPDEIFSIFKPIIKIDPYTDIVNSVLILKK